MPSDFVRPFILRRSYFAVDVASLDYSVDSACRPGAIGRPFSFFDSVKPGIRCYVGSRDHLCRTMLLEEVPGQRPSSK
jgi:hypothetical protein